MSALTNIITAPVNFGASTTPSRKTSLGFDLSGFDPSALLAHFDTIQVKNRGQQFLFSRTGDSYVDNTGAFKTTDTANNAPQAPGTLAQAQSLLAGAPTFVTGQLKNPAGPAPSLLSQPTVIMGVAGFIGIMAMLLLRKHHG